MRTIKKIFADRLKAQASEAKTQGYVKIASQLERIINHEPCRDNDEMYVYAASDFEDYVENAVWNIIVRAADFYNANIDALTLQPIVEKFSSEIIKEACIHFGKEDGVGAYEPLVPGQEISKRAAIEIDE